MRDRHQSIDEAGRSAPPAGRWRSRAVLAVTAAVLFTSAGGTVVAPDGPGAQDGGRTPAGSASPAGASVALGGAAMSCVEGYHPDAPRALTRRAFAFDGTVATIVELEPGGTQVTFRVEEWFRGWGDDRVTLEMYAPGQPSTFDIPDYRVGSRLLVSGDDRWGNEQLADPVVWYCGFTLTRSPSVADQWRQLLNPVAYQWWQVLV